MIRSFRLTNTTWNADIGVRVEGLYKSAHLWAQRELEAELEYRKDSQNMAGCCWRAHGHVAIWFREIPTLEFIAHESVHAVVYLLHIRGIDPLTEDSSIEEVYAYFLGWLIPEIFNLFYDVS